MPEIPLSLIHERKAKRRLLIARSRGAVACALILAGLAAFFAHGAVQSGYNWQWEKAWPFFFAVTDSGISPGPLLREGLVATLRISTLALIVALSAGIITAVLRLAGGRLLKSLCLAYVETVRNTPLMVQLLAVYALAPVSWGFSAEGIAILVLGLFEGAYMSEVFRAGVLAVPEGQWEAAYSLGLPGGAVFGNVVLPQALRHSMPPLLSQSVSLLKDSSLASIIAVSELTQRAGLAVSDTFLSFEIWLPVAAIYLIFALLLSGLAMLLQNRLSRGFAKVGRH